MMGKERGMCVKQVAHKMAGRREREREGVAPRRNEIDLLLPHIFQMVALAARS